MSALGILAEKAYNEGVEVTTRMGHDVKGETVLFVICLQGPSRSVSRERAIDRFQISQWRLSTGKAMCHGFDLVAEELLKVFDAEPWRPPLKMKRPLSFIYDEQTRRIHEDAL